MDITPTEAQIIATALRYVAFRIFTDPADASRRDALRDLVQRFEAHAHPEDAS